MNPLSKLKPAAITLAMAFLCGTVHAGSDDTNLSVKAAAAKHAAFKFDTFSQLAHKWKMLGAAGMRLKDIEVFVNKTGALSYSGVWEPGAGKHALYAYDSWNDFVDKWEELSASGYRLIDIERAIIDGKYWYYGAYRSGNDAYGLYRYSSWDAFVDRWKTMNDSGQRLVDIDVSVNNGTTTYIGVWRAGSGKYALYKYSSWSSFVDKWSELGGDGYQMADMDVTEDASGNTQYIGVWKGGSSNRALYRYTSWNSFKNRWARLAQGNRSLLDLEIVQRGNGGHYYIGSYSAAPSTPATGPDLNEMAQVIENTLAGSVVGLSYALSQNGQLAYAGSLGKAQRWPDADINMSSKTRSTIASVSKNITAPMLYKLLDENNLSLDSPIRPWLPSSWTFGSGYANNNNGVTFRQLLTHTSGIGQRVDQLVAANTTGIGTTWDGLNNIVSYSVIPGSAGNYENVNYALIRVMIPELWKAAGGPQSAVTKNNITGRYLNYLNTLVLSKEGIDRVQCSADGDYTEALSYDFNNPSAPGVVNTFAQDDCGGHAVLQMSAQEMTRYAAAVRYDTDMLSNANENTMKQNLAGWSGAIPVTGGTAYTHGGDWFVGGETHTCIADMPFGVNASIIINSQEPTEVCTLLTDAFNAAM